MSETSSSGPVTESIQSAAKRLRSAHSVVALTGAGVSAESGVPTFRGPGGLWRTYRPEDLATAEAFARDPRLVWDWYAERRDKVAACRPNRAHEALAVLESRVPDFLLVTQNVDGLHAAAGSSLVFELHGSLWRTRCTGCGVRREDRRVPLPELPPRCLERSCAALLRPDVVWFGEPLLEEAVTAALAAARRAELVLVVGTSSIVYPAAALPQIARSAGAFVVEVNPEETPLTRLAHVSIRGTAGEIVSAILEAAG